MFSLSIHEWEAPPLGAIQNFPVPDGSHSPAEPRRQVMKEAAVIFCGLLVLVSLLAFNGYRAHSKWTWESRVIADVVITQSQWIKIEPRHSTMSLEWARGFMPIGESSLDDIPLTGFEGKGVGLGVIDL
ncbi:hypothetical protein VNO78_07854 [Psophocarpus tetragonolobus]|uniref:beta-fructofuranosidase n=1 Tax=Psophocarpus tetragonolobus TaxID=3891 RepID=A0AAN9STS4_PSOTE